MGGSRHSAQKRVMEGCDRLPSTQTSSINCFSSAATSSSTESTLQQQQQRPKPPTAVQGTGDQDVVRRGLWARDQLCQAAGYRITQTHTQSSPGPEQLRTAFCSMYSSTPVCVAVAAVAVCLRVVHVSLLNFCAGGSLLAPDHLRSHTQQTHTQHGQGGASSPASNATKPA